MASRPHHSFKTILSVANISEPTPGPDYADAKVPDATKYQKIAYVTSLSGPSLDKTVNDMTHLESPAKFKEKISGFKDAGQISATLLMWAPQYQQLVKLWHGTSGGNYADDRFWFKITNPDGGTMECVGFIKSIGQEATEDDKVTCPVVIELSGPILYTKPSGDSALSSLASYAAPETPPTQPMY